MYTYTYTYVERDREDFKSRVVLVQQNLTNNQATHKAEKHAHLVYLLPVLFPLQNRRNLAALMARSRQ